MNTPDDKPAASAPSTTPQRQPMPPVTGLSFAFPMAFSESDDETPQAAIDDEDPAPARAA